MLLHGNKLKLNSDLIPFNLKGIDGKFFSDKELNGANVTVIAFICNHCPYVKAIMNRLVDLQYRYFNSGVRFVGINPNDTENYPEDSFENMIKFAEKYKLSFPYLIDETQEIAKSYDAVCTPDIFVYDRNRKLKYKGRIDDNWKDENAVSEKDLEKAINHLLNDEEIKFEQIPSMGCSIKWKNK